MLSSTILTLVLLPPRPRPLQTPASPQSPPATAAASSSHRPGWRRASSCRAKVSAQVWVVSFLPRVGVWILPESIHCSHLTMTQKCGRWLKVCSLGKLLLDTVSSNVWSTQAARQGFTSPLSTI